MPTMRDELVAIGEDLIAVGSTSGPVDLTRIGNLLDRLARIFGRYENAGRAVRQNKRKLKRGKQNG